jgi:replication-associated recombination protein RarA
MTELVRPSSCDEILGQENGMRALRAALWGKNPQHVIIYGPPGVGKTAAARVILEEIKKSGIEKGNITLLVKSSEISKMTGQKGMNKEKLRVLGYEVTVKGADELEKYEIKVVK